MYYIRIRIRIGRIPRIHSCFVLLYPYTYTMRVRTYLRIFSAIFFSSFTLPPSDPFFVSLYYHNIVISASYAYIHIIHIILIHFKPCYLSSKRQHLFTSISFLSSGVCGRYIFYPRLTDYFWHIVCHGHR